MLSHEFITFYFYTIVGAVKAYSMINRICDQIQIIILFNKQKMKGKLMKTNILRISKVPKIAAESQNDFYATFNKDKSNSPHLENGVFEQILQSNAQNSQSLVSVMKQLLKENKKNELEARDRFIIVDLPQTNSDGHLDDDALEEWITEVCSSTFSSAFNYFTEDKMSYDQAKVFCSQGILKNIFYLTQKYHLSSQQMQLLNEHIQQETVPYMQRKYPLTQSVEINKLIDSEMKDFDNRQYLENNYLQKTDILFTYRESGNYNDLIMRLMNKIVTDIDLHSPNSQATPYEQFYRFTSQMFEKVYSEKWMDGNKQETNQSQGDQLTVKQLASNEKYAQKVRQYTHYAIGRKLQPSTPIFSQQEIQSGNLVIKSQSILRVLTKWCEQLWNKFKTKNYFLDRSQNVRVQQINGNINTMFMWMKAPLNDLVEAQKLKIKQFMQKVQENNFDQQSKILISEIQKDGFNYIEKHQKACGKFSHKIIKNLHLYVVLYLNRIIHGLLAVSKRLYEEKLSSKARWTSPPDLMSFTIGDIMRCKCSSKQREIIKIFQYLRQESLKNPKIIKIIRIKNRLKMGTNDVLINIMFCQKFLCQIQLAVKSKQSKFIQYSNKFSHYIYELGRTLFGPITELCSVWTSLDPRAIEYLNLVKKQKKKPSVYKSQCLLKGTEHAFSSVDMPFMCNICKKSYSSTKQSLLYTHQRCIHQSCDYFICGMCRIWSYSIQRLKEEFMLEQPQQLIQACISLVNKKSQSQRNIPKYGVCIKIKSSQPKIIKFKVLQIMKTKSIYGLTKQQGKEKQKLFRIKQIQKKSAIKELLEEYLIFELSDDYGQRKIDINVSRAKIQVIIPEKCYSKESQIISIIDEGLNDETIKIIKGSEQQMKQIRNIQLADNNLTNIEFIAQNFRELDRLQLSRNRISNIEGISKMKKLLKLNLRNNILLSLPDELCNLPLLGLNIRYNRISQLPQNFGKLPLTKLQCDNNLLQSLPKSFQNLTKLSFIDLSKNKLKEVPEYFMNFQKLKELLIAKNRIEMIPEQIGKLKSLVSLDFSGCPIKNLPSSLFQLNNLEELSLSTEVSQLSSDIKKLKKLKKLVLILPNITNLPQEMATITPQLVNLRLEKCKIEKIPEWLRDLKKIETLEFVSNGLSSFPQWIEQLSSLRFLKIQSQNLMELPRTFQKMTELRTLSLLDNNFTTIPNEIANLPKLHSLNLKSNNIKNINDHFFSRQSKIEMLDLSNNNLVKVPLCFKEMKYLKKLVLDEGLENNIVQQS